MVNRVLEAKRTRPRSGTRATRAYCEERGGRSTDPGRPGHDPVWESPFDGPIRATSEAHRRGRVLAALEGAGPPLELLEYGCGANPELRLLPLCTRYTGIDFSSAGLDAARSKLAGQGVPLRLLEADMCHLPFADGCFDAVYSAHAVYPIAEAAGQAQALDELARVTRRHGVIVLILANAFPLLFPGRLARRVVADTPLVRTLAERLRRPPPIADSARPLGWMRRQLSRYGEVEIQGYMVPSVWFHEHVPEHSALGRALWRSIAWLEDEHPQASRRLGCYVQITVRRS